jgi:hypothetical protein
VSVAVTSNLHPSCSDTIMPKTLATATVDRLLQPRPRRPWTQPDQDSALKLAPTRPTLPTARRSAAGSTTVSTACDAKRWAPGATATPTSAACTTHRAADESSISSSGRFNVARAPYGADSRPVRICLGTVAHRRVAFLGPHPPEDREGQYDGSRCADQGRHHVDTEVR